MMAGATCTAELNTVWKAPDFREREGTPSRGQCGHTEGRHEYGICYDCDINNETAAMHHAFTTEETP